MKRIAALVLGAVVALGSASSASAVDVKVAGEWDFAFGWAKNTTFYANDNKNGSNEDSFIARNRVRTQVNFIASEQLQGVLMFEIGDINWGRNENGAAGQGSGGALDADGVNVETKLAYLDWMIPETEVSVRMGIQTVMLPSGTGLGNPVINNDVAGITVNVPINDMFGITAFWVRPFDEQDFDGDRNLADETDIFALMLPVTGEGWNVTPWAAYGNVGMGSGYLDYIAGDFLSEFDHETVPNGDATQTWWAGVAVEVSVFDPLTFAFDAMYGHMNKGRWSVLDNSGPAPVSEEADARMEGWFIDATLNYKLDWGTPGLFGWWTSGDDAGAVEEGDFKFGRMPAIGFDNGFAPTGFGAPGSAGIGSDTAISATMIGTWGVGAQIADMSFVDKLSHTLRLSYYRGTNDPNVANMQDSMPFLISGESVYMTTDDWAFEVNFDHTYQIYENLTAILELSYIHLDLDEDTWSFNDLHDTDDAWKAQMLLQYAF